MTPLAAFAAKWSHPQYPPGRVDADALKAAQATFGAHFPADYVAQILETGLPRPTSTLLHSVVEQDIGINPVSDFFSADQIIETTQGWRRIGLPQSTIAFASDASGNLFCFDTEDPGIWFFDHDFDTLEVVASTFSEWIEAQCAITPVAES